MADTKRPSEMNELDLTTVQEYFKAIEKGHEQEVKAYKKLMTQMAEEYTKKQRDSQQQLVKDIASLEATLSKQGITNTRAYREAMIKENAELEKKKSLEIANSIYKKQVELNTKAGKEKQKQELLASKEINEAWIKQYQEIVAGGGSLNQEQKEDLELKKKQVQQANEASKQAKKQEVLSKALNNLISEGLNVINNSINTYAKLQSGFNARMQGTNSITFAERMQYGLNTFGALENRLSTAVGIQPYVKTETMLTNLSDLVSQGIASNVEQRAFLASIKDNIATTFEVANNSLLRIVRLQQSDSTAARLGMEAYLTKFLNNLVENTEYLNQTFDNVSDALIEASSQMSMKASTEFEYVVQKWLGALTGTGLSEATSQGIAQAIGYLGSGNISALNNSSMQNLLVMAASRAGLDYASLLTQGLNASSTNQLMRAVADYMVELGGSGNNVVRSQLAQTFGLSISDLTAARQLSSDFNRISKSSLSLGGMYNELGMQMSTMSGRMSVSEMIQNVFDNSLFGLATNIAGNPALAALWKITDMIQSTTGGINIPAIQSTVMGTGGGFDLNATIEQLMKLGLVGIGSLGMIGDVISGISSTVNPAHMLTKLGINPLTTGIRRGEGLGQLVSGFTNSVAALVGNASGSDISESVLAVSEGEAQKQMDEKQAEENQDNPQKDMRDYLLGSFSVALNNLSDRVNDIADKISYLGV